jgi:hypothetical protein
MQASSQLIRSNQKRLEEVRHIKDALATGRSVLTDQERDKIIQRAASLGRMGRP